MSETATPRTHPRAEEARRYAGDAAIAVVVAAIQALGAYGNALHHAGLGAQGGLALRASGSAFQFSGGDPSALQHVAAPGPVAYAVLVVSGLLLVARRRFPVTVLTLTCALSIGYWASERFLGPIFLSDIIAFITVVVARKRVPALLALVAYWVGYQWLPVATGTREAPSALAAVLAATGLVLLLGIAELARLRSQRAAALAREREELARRQASEERLRTARDLHDVVAHNISVINVQANVALHLMDRQPEAARDALTAIHQVSRQALEELRSVLGVLRDSGSNARRSPSPGLGRLPELAASARAAGLTVLLEEDGRPRPLPAEVDVAAYRIVQEALTNSARHASGSTATVRIHYRDKDLVVQVDNDSGGAADGPPAASQPAAGGGSGIVGMTERAHALGGLLRAGPRPGGGFRVRARLPLDGRPA